jgi:prophage endopeptidase
MNSSELTMLIAGGLLLALIAGWTLRWIFGLLNRPPPEEPIPETELEAQLREALEGKAAVESKLASVEDDLSRKLVQTQAELEATMDGLRDARRQMNEMRDALEQNG